MTSGASDIDKFFLVEDPNETGLARDLVNSGAVPHDLVPVTPENAEEEVCLILLLF